MKKKRIICLLTALVTALSAAGPVSAGSAGIDPAQLEEMSLEDLQKLQLEIGQQISSLEAAAAEDAGNLFLETAGGTLLYTGFLLNDQNFKTSGSSDYIETLLILFDYSNKEDQEKQVQSDFRIQAYQYGVELSKASSWISSETLPEEVNNTYKTVLKNGTISAAIPFVPIDNSPVTIVVTAMGLAAQGEKASMELESWKEEEVPETSAFDENEAMPEETEDSETAETEEAAAEETEEDTEEAVTEEAEAEDAEETAAEEAEAENTEEAVTEETEAEAADTKEGVTEETVAEKAEASETKPVGPDEVDDLLQGIWMLQTIDNLFTFEDGDVSITTAGNTITGMYMINTKINSVDLLMNTSIGLVSTSLPFKVENETLVLSNNQGETLKRWEVEIPTEPVIYTDEETIEKVQEALNEAGYDCGTPDGIAGRNTYAAMNEYQEDHELPVTNDITDELLKSLGI